jgi:hypothetical protein
VSLADFVRIHNDCARSKLHDPYSIRDLPFKKASARIIGLVKFPVAIPDLTRRGYDLRGACLCMTGDDARVLHAYYESHTSPQVSVSLFSVDREIRIGACAAVPKNMILPSEGEKEVERCYRSITTGDLTLLQWNESRQSLILCGHVGEMILREIAKDITVYNNRKLYSEAAVDR